ncbi:hypothetical protein J8I29_17410 [Labrys sp. LIt4]|uniref:Uncharacterized protein n=1 Tax=Labrys okinawensis TaxID=346911 RepID=A0A2S9QIH7_9HYPH|nr:MULTISPECIES: hypothetical protein [Labrys]MBP0581108.1 hypothetical protein [Labrys sp. LIt4]PRH89167.1 hypothetical protein C5L14_00815 [Labrys okinawensis]
MVSNTPEPIAVGSLVTFSAAHGQSQPDFHEGALITLVPGVGDPVIGRILVHTSEEVSVAVGDAQLVLTPVALTLDENEGFDYTGAWAVRSTKPLA